MYGYYGKGKHSKKELEEMLEKSFEQIEYLYNRIDSLKNSSTGNFG